MAEKLKKYEFSKGRKHRYPWDQWSDGSIWLLKRGVDYDNAVSMVGSCRAQATRLGRLVRINQRDGGDSIYIQFHDGE